MNVYQWLCVAGIPSAITLIITRIITKRLNTAESKAEEAQKRSAAIALGIQALLRAQMIDYWNKYSEKGYAPIYAKDSFESCWVQYHTLGANGVMNGIHDKFMELPDSEKGAWG